jgi:hypothetical protein
MLSLDLKNEYLSYLEVIELKLNANITNAL